MKLMALDGNSIVNRAFYGIRLLTTADGTPTNGVYGFLTILMKLLEDEKPDALCVTFDLSAPTFRHIKYDGYKATRHAMPEELKVQMPILKDVLDAMNVKRYELSGWEADDLLGTISKKCADSGWECVIVTGDRDSLQLVNDSTRVLHVKTRMGRTETVDYTPARFSEEYGFEPIKLIDLKALMGDSSDNIPGVSGVGEKTAMALVQSFGEIENIYGSIDSADIKDAVRKKLDAGRESAFMSKELATIRLDAPMEFIPADNKLAEYDNDALYELFRKLEFTKLTEKLGLHAPADCASEEIFECECTSEEVITSEDAEKMFAAVSGHVVAVAMENSADTCCVVDDCNAYILRRVKTEDYIGVMRRLFGAEFQKAGHNVKDIMRRLDGEGIYSDGWVTDTALCAYLLSPTDSSYDIPRLTQKYGGYTFGEVSEGDGQMSIFDIPDPAANLICEAAAIALLRDVLEAKLEELHMTELYRSAELPLCRVLADMEAAGFYVDRNALSSFGNYLGEEMAKLEAEIYELGEGKFNINSPKQLGEVLFERLMLPAPKKTKTGWSTGADVLEKLEDKHPIIKKVLNYRQLSKLKSTYTDGLQKVIAPDGRIHTSFQMTVTATGRLSSTEPNLQNIPVRSELGAEIRKMFVAEEGNVLVDADYSQIELRLLAHISGDERMRNAFLTGEDIHAVTASQVFDTPLSEVTHLQRSRAKAVNFGIVYGISAFSLSQDIGVSVNEAKRYMDSYLEKYSGVRQYMADIVDAAKRDGFVTTIFGRRRYLPELTSSNRNIRMFGERVALNAPIQGTAADIMKLAMVNAARGLREAGLKARIVLQVHDELIVECHEAEAEKVSEILRREMENAAGISVPLTAEAHSGKSWADAK